MSVYVDVPHAKLGRMTMCHMLADSRRELDAMADKIGVQRIWIQHEGTDREHYDISLSKRKLAVQNGAIEIDKYKLVEILRRRRESTGEVTR